MKKLVLSSRPCKYTDLERELGTSCSPFALFTSSSSLQLSSVQHEVTEKIPPSHCRCLPVTGQLWGNLSHRVPLHSSLLLCHWSQMEIMCYCKLQLFPPLTYHFFGYNVMPCCHDVLLFGTIYCDVTLLFTVSVTVLIVWYGYSLSWMYCELTTCRGIWVRIWIWTIHFSKISGAMSVCMSVCLTIYLSTSVVCLKNVSKFDIWNMRAATSRIPVVVLL